jgi:hypothetical protein
MQVTHSQPAIGYPAASIEVGRSTWDNAERSIRLRCPSANGGFSRGSPEVPEWCIEEFLAVALAQGLITPKKVARILARAL